MMLCLTYLSSIKSKEGVILLEKGYDSRVLKYLNTLATVLSTKVD
jgi:hypothetical protein